MMLDLILMRLMMAVMVSSGFPDPFLATQVVLVSRCPLGNHQTHPTPPHAVAVAGCGWLWLWLWLWPWLAVAVAVPVPACLCRCCACQCLRVCAGAVRAK